MRPRARAATRRFEAPSPPPLAIRRSDRNGCCEKTKKKKKIAGGSWISAIAFRVRGCGTRSAVRSCVQWRSLLALADLFVINCPYTPEEEPQRASACLCTCSCASLRLCLSGKGIRRCACRVSCPRAVCPRAVCRVRVSCVASAANSWPSARTGRRAHQISAGTLGTRASRATSTSASR